MLRDDTDDSTHGGDTTTTTTTVVQFVQPPESAIDAQLAFARGTATSEALLEQSRRKVAQDGHLARAFVRREDDDDALMRKAMDTARRSDANRKAGNASKSFLDGIPVAVKENFALRGEKVSAGSKMLSENVASYTATVIDRLENSGAVVFGQTRMDEFGMGSHSQNVGILREETVKNQSTGVKSGRLVWRVSRRGGERDVFSRHRERYRWKRSITSVVSRDCRDETELREVFEVRFNRVRELIRLPGDFNPKRVRRGDYFSHYARRGPKGRTNGGGRRTHFKRRD